MALWVVRAGKDNEFLQRFLDTSRVYITWDGLAEDLSGVSGTVEMAEILGRVYPGTSPASLRNQAAQLFGFVKRMQPGDWVMVPNKSKRTLNFAEVVGDYTFDATAEDPYYHYRDVRIFAPDVPRAVFPQDILYSMGALPTIFQVARNDGERRVRDIAAAGWQPERPTAALATETESGGQVDLEQLAHDQVARLITTRFKGHGLARLVEAILRAQGHQTYRSPEGPDKGVDLLAAPGTLGFGQPRLCVQVKSGDAPVDHPTLQQLLGAMNNVQADHGLLVAWGGFKATVEKEEAAQFFRVRLWDQQALINALLESYDRLDEDIRAELPLKRIWTVASEDTEPESFPTSP